MTGKDRTAQSSLLSDIGDHVAGQPQSPGADYANWLGTSWAYCLGELGAELSHFMADRIREDVRTQHAMLHCKDPAEVQEIQKAFIDQAIEDYIAETGRLVEIGNRWLSREAAEEPTS